MAKINRIAAREVLDSRGFPTIEVEVSLSDAKGAPSEVTGRAIVPSGASTGEGEALELRDQDVKRYQGKGVLKAVDNVRRKITPALLDKSFDSQLQLDDLLRNLDGTPNKSQLGANAILGVSMAFTRATALFQNVPTYQLIASMYNHKDSHLLRRTGSTLPVPLMNVINGGKHADNELDVQEFMIVPARFDRFSDALRAGAEVFHCLKKILHQKGLSTAVGDEGGFAPSFNGANPHHQALSTLMDAIHAAGYTPGVDIFLALDAAASEFRDTKEGYRFEKNEVSSEEMISIYSQWAKEFPILSIEDGLSEHDWQGWQSLTRTLGNQCQLVGDDIFVTNPIYLKQGIEKKVANAILIKLNQIGTVSETLETMRLATQSGYHSITSHRSGETEDTFIAELAVGTDCGQIKTGSASRTDRIAKYNQLLRIEEALGSQANFAGMKVFERLKK